MEIHRVSTTQLGFEAWPLFLNEWKWPTMWACMNLNLVPKGILCNSVLFDLETVPLLIWGRTGDGGAHLALWGECYTGRQQPACSQTPLQTTEATQMQLGAGGAAHVHPPIHKLCLSEDICLAKNNTRHMLLPVSRWDNDWGKVICHLYVIFSHLLIGEQCVQLLKCVHTDSSQKR